VQLAGFYSRVFGQLSAAYALAYLTG